MNVSKALITTLVFKRSLGDEWIKRMITFKNHQYHVGSLLVTWWKALEGESLEVGVEFNLVEIIEEVVGR